MRSTAVHTDRIYAIYSDELTGAHPDYPRPWEDTTLPAQERYDSYREVVRAKCKAIVEASVREGITLAERRELKDNPDTQFWVGELTRINKESPQDFCRRIDGGLHRELLGKNFLGAEEWRRGFKVDVGKVPPIPEWITKELLEEKCQLHPGQQVKDTHLLVLVPKTVDGKPYSAVKLRELCAGTKGSGDKLIYGGYNDWKEQQWAKAPQLESEWVLIPKRDPDPTTMKEAYPSDWDSRHFRSKSIADQKKVHDYYRQDYREAKALEVMTAALLNDVVHGERILSDCLLRAQEPTASGGRVVVGSFRAVGLGVRLDNDDSAYVFVGRALARKQVN